MDQNNLRLLLWLLSNGVEPGRVLTIGRLGVFLSPEICRSDALHFGHPIADADWQKLSKDNYCESILTLLGASSVNSLDASEYEGASLIQDLNLPLSRELIGKCDLLFDGGSLEHVFNVPEALRSYVQLVRPGGWIVLDVPCDGCSGHGFYQFSPELFFRFFQRRSGCAVKAMICVQDEPASAWFSIADPERIKQRVEIDRSKSLHLFVVVQRLNEVGHLSLETFNPVQADYAAAWNDSVTHAPGNQTSTLRSKTFDAVRTALRAVAPIRYWRWSVNRNDRRRRKRWMLGKSEHLERVNPFSWRLPDHDADI